MKMDYVENWTRVSEPIEGTSFNFLLTNFIFPLKEPITLSGNWDFVLDNPRTAEEILFFENALVNKIAGGTETYASGMNLENSLTFFLEVFGPIDPYIKELFENHDIQTAAKQIVKMLIIFRFNPHRNAEAIKKQNQLGIQNLKINGEEIDGEEFVVELNRENAIKYSHALSLLIHRRGRYFEGDSFLVENPHNYFKPDAHLNKELEEVIGTWLRGISSMKKYIAEDIDVNFLEIHDWGVFPLYLTKLLLASEGLENLIVNGRDEQLFYIGELVKQALVISDEKSKLIALVSAIELLLTRNPDQSRFNVEDSITKQFVLKTAVVIYKNDMSKPIDVLGARLKEIYSQRSNIAHGNFKEFNKFIQSLSKRADHDQYFISLVEDCFWYLRLVLEEYGKDLAYIDFLKKQ